MVKFMKKLLYFTLCLILFFEVTIYMLPKKVVWQYINNKILSHYLISLDSSSIKEMPFGLVLENGSLKYDKLEVFSGDSIEIVSSIFIEKVVINKIHFSDIAMDIFPKNIEKMVIYWTPLTLKKIEIRSSGDIGTISGYIDISKREIVIHLKPSTKAKKSYSNILRQMKKSDKGYKYVKNF